MAKKDKAQEQTSNGSATRNRINATPVMEEVEAPPTVSRTATDSQYVALVEQLLAQPGKWFRVFKGLPTIGHAQSRTTALKRYEGIEAVSRTEGEGDTATASVYARAVAQG
jgi:hypothetical protein